MIQKGHTWKVVPRENDKIKMNYGSKIVQLSLFFISEEGC